MLSDGFTISKQFSLCLSLTSAVCLLKDSTCKKKKNHLLMRKLYYSKKLGSWVMTSNGLCVTKLRLIVEAQKLKDKRTEGTLRQGDVRVFYVSGW